MKAVMISIQSKWCELIASGKKTIEVRKTAPTHETPFKCYIYCTKAKSKEERLILQPFGYELGGLESNLTYRSNGKVIGEFVCDRITKYECSSDGFGELATTCGTCLTYDEILNYCSGNDLYGWHISDLVIYDKPKELSEFFTPIEKRPSYMLEKPPQSWCYVEVDG